MWHINQDHSARIVTSLRAANPGNLGCLPAEESGFSLLQAFGQNCGPGGCRGRRLSGDKSAEAGATIRSFMASIQLHDTYSWLASTLQTENVDASQE